MSDSLTEPHVKWERKEFIELAKHPDFPDEMAFQIDREHDPENPDALFSMEALDQTAEEFHTYMLARILGRMAKTGSPPLHMRVNVVIDWHPGDPRIDPEVGPFYHIAKDEHLTPLDPERRWKRGA